VPNGGRVLFTRLRDNLSVKTGDTLLILDPAEIDTETDHFVKQINERKSAIEDLKELINALPTEDLPWLTTALYQRDYQDFRHQWDEAKLRATHATRQLNRQEELFAAGVIAPMEIERFRFESELANSGQTQLKERQLHLWAQELIRNKRELAELQRETATLHQRSRHLVIIAPVSGHLTNTSALLPGSFVGPAQEVAVVSPSGELEVALHVSPRDIGLLRKGTNISLSMDAFSHTRWGLAYGVVHEISNDVNTDLPGHPYFLVHCTLKADELRLPSGHLGKLTKGMTATAHFTLARRTLAQLLLDRLEDWLPIPQNTQQ
jgi:HlyD family secretion protein